jgi:hypothetical protein
MSLRMYARRHAAPTAVALFLAVFGLTAYIIKPAFLFRPDGTPREFGVGFRNKTFMPLWLFSLLTGVLCYFAVVCYATYGYG